MKFRVSMKDPDTLYDAIREAVEKQLEEREDLDDEERELLQESREEKAREICARWFEYGEYLRVDVDTEAKTCVVVEGK